MTDIPPRCPFCAGVLKIQPTFWTRLGFKPAQVRCPTCQREFDQREAHTMGAQYWNWAEQFRQNLTAALTTAPILSEPAAHKALGSPIREDTRIISSLEELVRICLRHHRHAIVEMARGREASLEVVALKDQSTSAMEAIATVSKTSMESGAKQHEQVIARTGMSHFVLFTYPGPDGVEPRIQNALHQQSHAIGTHSRAIADLQSRHDQAHAHQA